MMDYTKTTTGWRPNVPKPRKDGRGDGGVHGGGVCKHICDKFEKSRPYKEPYNTHVFCTRCHGTQLSHGGVWMEKESLKDNGRCPCCNFRPRTKPKQSGNYHKTHGVK